MDANAIADFVPGRIKALIHRMRSRLGDGEVRFLNIGVATKTRKTDANRKKMDYFGLHGGAFCRIQCYGFIVSTDPAPGVSTMQVGAVIAQTGPTPLPVVKDMPFSLSGNPLAVEIQKEKYGEFERNFVPDAAEDAAKILMSFTINEWMGDAEKADRETAVQALASLKQAS
ncbi:hypothetical protein BDP27DRAFT_1332511 [Rhodocollybia butyracea]|uniref:Uncharacterized protein n=1 Tax=Rhodocollybia butyracea TaxID=206335 RepID=A0A9P5U3N1_9AGAR|nr:hypothetical protein BDP27DRAFT_1332511 [Rhodocollybia butyracea]